MHGTHLTAPTQIHKLHSLPLMSNPAQEYGPDCVRFSCCSPIDLLQLLLPVCVLLLASFSTAQLAAAPRLRPLRLLLPDCSVPFELQLLLPHCVRFNCSSPIGSASTTAPRLHSPAVPEDSSPCPMFFAELEIEVRRSRVTSLVPPHEHPTSVTHTRLKS